MCNTLAKRAVAKAIQGGYKYRSTQFLLREDTALMIQGNKVTGNISNPLRFYASKEEARKHYMNHKKDKWTAEQFQAVDWEHLELAMKGKADMYKVWRSKQT